MDINLNILLPTRVLQGDFSQGATHFSESSRGKQCVCNCFMFLLYVGSLNGVQTLSKHDLHAILMSDDVLYSLRKICYSKNYPIMSNTIRIISRHTFKKYLLVPWVRKLTLK